MNARKFWILLANVCGILLGLFGYILDGWIAAIILYFVGAGGALLFGGMLFTGGDTQEEESDD